MTELFTQNGKGKSIFLEWGWENSQGVCHWINEQLDPGFSQSRIHTSAEQTCSFLGQKESKPRWVSASRVWVSHRQSGEGSTRLDFSTWENVPLSSYLLVYSLLY